MALLPAHVCNAGQTIATLARDGGVRGPAAQIKWLKDNQERILEFKRNLPASSFITPPPPYLLAWYIKQL